MKNATAWVLLCAGLAGAAEPTASIGADAGRPAVAAGDAGAAGPPATPGLWPDSAVPTDVIDTALKHGELTGFLKAVAEAELGEALKGPGPFTVLAPSDAAIAAFAKKSKGKEWQKLLADKERLGRVVQFHVVPGRLTKADLEKLKVGDKLPTLLAGKRVKLGKKKDRLTFDKGTLVEADLDASNGVLHVIDALLAP